jgi:hypothetical protein
MRGIGSDGLSFEFVAPVAINYGGWFVLSLSFSSDILCYFFVLLHACLSLPLSVQAVKQEVCWHASFSFLLSENRGRKNKKILN